MELSFEFANENNAGMLFPGRVLILALPCSPSTPVHVYMDIIFMNVEGLEGWMWVDAGHLGAVQHFCILFCYYIISHELSSVMTINLMLLIIITDCR